jgi:hypothetical protein
MAAKNDTNVPIFDVKDYTNWKIRIYKFLTNSMAYGTQRVNAAFTRL